jgi:multidrug transporter EmrE-like cation transporter
MDLFSSLLYISEVILSSLPALLIKHYLKTDNNIIWIFIAIISYISLIYIYTFALKNKDVTIIYTAIQVSSIILICLLDMFFLKTVFTMKSVIGIILGLISMILLLN